MGCAVGGYDYQVISSSRGSVCRYCRSIELRHAATSDKGVNIDLWLIDISNAPFKRSKRVGSELWVDVSYPLQSQLTLVVNDGIEYLPS